MKQLVLILCILIYNFPYTLSSSGDQSPFYQKCLSKCRSLNCTQDGQFYIKGAELQQDPWSRLLGWTCHNECQYECMWKTTRAFIARGYPVVQFHGKWPFRRMLGMQEPASCVCSILNLCAHLYMWNKFHKRINCNPAADSHGRLVLFWNVFIAICVVSWTCSAVFHARDTPATELADYTGALAMVVSLFIAAVVRVFYRASRLRWVVTLATLVHFAAHVRYLHAGHIDYSYNIKVNVFFGVAGSLLWVLWSVYHMAKHGRCATYVGWLQMFLILSGLALCLEISDAPPYGEVWDPHALWHLATAPLPLLFYRFVMSDIEYLINLSAMEKTDLKLA